MSAGKRASAAAVAAFAAAIFFLVAALNVGSIPERPLHAEKLSVEQVRVYSSKVVVDLANATKIVFAGTGSMAPLIEEGMTGLEFAPQSPDQIRVGDVISYNAEASDAVIIHEVAEVGRDAEGWFARTKGYNAKKADPEKVRFAQVKGVLVALFW